MSIFLFAMAVLQAMHTSKGGQAKSRVHPTADGSRTSSQAQKKPGQTLMDKLRAAQKLQNVPVAVIRGKQSIKANTSASRER